ncbi:MAG: hypothetical protein AB7O52_08815 [Planctomycetota bacterium]
MRSAKTTRLGKQPSRLGRYLRVAFFQRWNLLLTLVAGAAALLSPMPEALLPLVGAAEIAYLVGLTSVPKFRDYVDARDHAAERPALTAERAPRTLDDLVRGLSPTSRQRFERLRDRCVEMQVIAKGVGGRPDTNRHRADEFAAPGLDRLLWIFLRLLHSRNSLDQFLAASDRPALERAVDDTRTRLERARNEGDERLTRSLSDSLATCELRLDNYEKAAKNAEYVAIELDRLEGKIHTLSEMAVNRQDPDFISREVDSVAASMQETEATMEQLHLVDGLIADLDEPPPILTPGPRGVLRDEA